MLKAHLDSKKYLKSVKLMLFEHKLQKFASRSKKDSLLEYSSAKYAVNSTTDYIEATEDLPPCFVKTKSGALTARLICIDGGQYLRLCVRKLNQLETKTEVAL